jgi:hypothetical protein
VQCSYGSGQQEYKKKVNVFETSKKELKCTWQDED